MGDRGGDGRIANAHFANAEKVAALGNRFHAIGYGGGALGLIEGRVLCDVARGKFEGQFKNLETEIVGFADLVYRSAPRPEIFHHLPGDFLGIGRHPLGHHPMIARKHRDHGPLDAGRIVSLPAAKPFGDMLKPAERSQRLGQAAVAGPALFHGLLIGAWNIFQEIADIVERQSGGGVCHFTGTLLSTDLSQDSGSGRNMSDDYEPPSEAPRRYRPFTEFLTALRFLTRLPVPFLRTLDPPRLAAAMGMFPVAGAVAGAITGGSLVLCNLAGLPEFFCAAAALAVGLIVTGALHEDGLADVADGFGGGKTREQRLEIMRDSRIGAYGAMALVIVLLGRAALFASLLDLSPGGTIILIAAAGAFSRSLMVDLVWATRPARNDGLSVMAGRPSRNTTLIALLIGGFGAWGAAAYVLAPAAGLAALIAAGVTLAAVRALAMRKIGGQTGDVCGAGQVLTETAMLAVYAATLSLP